MAEAEQSPCSASAMFFCFCLIGGDTEFWVWICSASDYIVLSKDGGTSFYRFLVLDQAEAERCQV